MKKFAAVLLTVAVVFSFAACTKQKNEAETTTQSDFSSSTQAVAATEERVTEQSTESTKPSENSTEAKKSTTRTATTAKPTTTKKKDGFLASIPAISTAPPITSMYTTPYDNQQNITQAASATQVTTTAPSFLDTTELEPVTEAKLPEYDDSGIDDSIATASPEAIRQCARSVEQSLNNHAYAIQSLVNYCETEDEVHIDYFYGFVESAYISVVQVYDMHMQYENMQSMCELLEDSLDILYKILTESYTILELEEMLNDSAVQLEKVYNKCQALAGK